MDDIGPVGVSFFKEGGTVYFKHVLDARSAVGPREANQGDADRHKAEWDAFTKEHGKSKVPGADASTTDHVADAKRAQDELDEKEAQRAQAADDKRRAAEQQDTAKVDVKNTERAVRDADVEAREQKAAQEKADAAAHAKAKGK